jgi:EAL and modified HD-GYP domain-containing signal transduction protein
VLPLASIFRIDVHQVDEQQLDSIVKTLRKHKHLSLQALKIETLEEFRFYRDKGFDYLQGYFLSKPRAYSARDLPANKLAALHMLAELYKADIDFPQIQELIERDVALSFKLLKLINSSYFNVPHKVDSIKRAIVMLGMREVRNWASLIAIGSTSDNPVAMMEIALLRAKLCELVAIKAKYPPTAFFTVGMFSALDLIMLQPIDDIIRQLPLDDEVTTAILEREGVLGEALSCALAVEGAQWKDMRFGPLNRKQIVDAFKQAIQWTNEVVNKIQGTSG